MLTFKKLSKAYGGRHLFTNVTHTVNWGERVALVGPNGAGKSTLMKLVLGMDELDEGSIEKDDYLITGYLAQEAGEPGPETALEIAIGINAEMENAIRVIKECEAKGTTDKPEYGAAQDVFANNNGYQLEPKARRILKGLAFREADFSRPIREMSGGWIMRAHLARLLVMEPDILLLDEPTNHLDLLSLLWFQRHLKNYPGAILFISHDRDFMDQIAESVIEIEDGQFATYTGNYSDYLAEKEKRLELYTQAYRNQQKEIEHIQSFIDNFRSVASKASSVQSRVKMLEKMEKMDKPRAPRKVFAFNFRQPERSTQKVIELQNVAQSYGAIQVYKSLDLTVERGERIVLIGPNGAGKSTLMKVLAGVLPIQGGLRKPGPATKIGYFSQHRSDGLEMECTVLEEVQRVSPELREEEARAILGSFLFRRADVHKKVKVLSGGEKSRLSLVKFLVDPPNLLLMDEPTTHLDLLSVEALITALKRFEGTLVFISHDVHFIRALAERTLHISAGQFTSYSGNYDYYLEKSGLMDDAKAAITAGGELQNNQPKS